MNTSLPDHADIDYAENRYVAVLDVLGFRVLLNQLGTNGLVAKYAEALQKSLTTLKETRDEVIWHVSAAYVEDEGRPGSADAFAEPKLYRAPIFPRIAEVVTFSDSIFVFGLNAEEDTLIDVAAGCTAIFRMFSSFGLPLAGAISIGDAVVSRKHDIYVGTGPTEIDLSAPWPKSKLKRSRREAFHVPASSRASMNRKGRR